MEKNDEQKEKSLQAENLKAENLKNVVNVVVDKFTRFISKYCIDDDKKFPGELAFDNENQQLTWICKVNYWVEKTQEEKDKCEEEDDWTKRHKRISEDIKFVINFNQLAQDYLQNKGDKNKFHKAVTEHIRKFFGPLQGKTLNRKMGPINLSKSEFYDDKNGLQTIGDWNKDLKAISDYLVDDGTIRKLEDSFYEYKEKDGILKLVKKNENVIKNENNNDKNNNAIDMYNKNSTFISLTENIDEDNEKVEAAAKTLQNIYKIHSKINELEQKEKKEEIKEEKKEEIKEEKKEEIKEEIKDGINFHVSSDIHGDINCLNYNLRNIIELKGDNILVVDPINGKKIFEGSIGKIKNDLAKGDKSDIRRSLNETRKKLKPDERLKYVANMLGEGFYKGMKKNEENCELSFDNKNQKLTCSYSLEYLVKETEKKNEGQNGWKKIIETINIEIDFNEILRIYLQSEDIDKVKEYISSCFVFLVGKRLSPNKAINSLNDLDYGIGKFFDWCIDSDPLQALKNSLKYIKFSGCNICNENNIVLLNDFNIRDSFDPSKEKNIITGDHIDRGPHSTEVLCMELQVKEKLREKLKKEKKEGLNDDNSNENKIIEEKEDDDKKISEGEDGLVLVRGDHEFGCYGQGTAGNMPSENELAANLLAKEMITNGQLVPDYLHETNNKNIESHSHVMFLVPHVFQVFRQIDELIELNRIINDINGDDFFTKYRDNEFVKILIEYSEATEYGKIILQSLVETYKNALKNKKYGEILGRLGVTGENKNNINKISDLIAKYKSEFYKDWDSCVNAGYGFYKEVEKEFNLSTKDFFKLRSFAMDVFTSPIVNKEETKEKLISELAYGDMESYYSIMICSEDSSGAKTFDSVDMSKFRELLDCFADYFSNCNKGFCHNKEDVIAWNPYFQIDSCLKSLRIIKFKRNDGYAPNMYFERKLVKNLEGAWKIKDEPKSAKLTFPDVIQFAGHDRNGNHEIEIYDKSVVNNDPASSIGYSAQFPIPNEKKSNLYPSKFVYNSECPENANLVRCNVIKANTTDPGVDNYSVKSVHLNFWKEAEIKNDIKNDIKNENKKEKEVKIKNENKKEKEVKIKNENKKEKEVKIKIKTENKKGGEENEIINKSDIIQEKFIDIKDKNEKEKENKTSGMYLIKLILIILGLLLIAGGIALFLTASALVFKFLAISLGLLGAVGFGIGLLYNGIVERYCKESESCCFRFLAFSISISKQKSKGTNINLEEREKEKNLDILLDD